MKIPFFPNKISQKKINFIDLARQRHTRNSKGIKLGNLINKKIDSVIKHGQYILGPEVKTLENNLAKFTGANHCVGVSSGTDALLLALMALEVSSNDEVITTPFSFISTAEVIALLQAKPIFIDIDKDSYNLDYSQIESKINSKTKAIIAVSLYGQPANFSKINEVARKYYIPVIEDAAQSFGATHNGIKSCNLSDIGVTSFFPSKPLGCYGDGGACFTNNSYLAEKIRKISVHGQEKRYFHTEIGINGRLDTIQAAILLAKLEFYNTEIIKRDYLGRYYSKKLKSIGINTFPKISPENKSVYAQYTIRVNNREEFQKSLSSENIPTAVHYPTLIPDQPAFNRFISNQDIKKIYKIAEESSQTVVSLPFHPWLKISEIDYIVKKIEKIIDKNNSHLI